MKTMTVDDVKRVTEQLLNINDNVTTLDVKLELRNQNYFATQKQVSKSLMYIYRNDLITGLEYTSNGMYNVYFVSNVSQVSNDSNTVTTKTKNTWGSTVLHDWKVFHKDAPNEYQEFDNLTRNQARLLFANEHNFAYKDIRAHVK